MDDVYFLVTNSKTFYLRDMMLSNFYLKQLDTHEEKNLISARHGHGQANGRKVDLPRIKNHEKRKKRFGY
jgi:hypothetical protein